MLTVLQSDSARYPCRERAYVAASRRTNRSLQARVQSAHLASKIHQKRTGRYLQINEVIVANGEIYEEQADPVRPTTFLTVDQLLREKEINTLFAQAFSTAIANQGTHSSPHCKSQQAKDVHMAYCPSGMGVWCLPDLPHSSSLELLIPSLRSENAHVKTEELLRTGSVQDMGDGGTIVHQLINTALSNPGIIAKPQPVEMILSLSGASLLAARAAKNGTMRQKAVSANLNGIENHWDVNFDCNPPY